MYRLLRIIQNILLSMLIIGVLFGCTDSRIDEKPIVVDFEKEYPIMNLKLSDIADVSYIKLQGEDSIKMLSSPSGYCNNIYVDDEHIFIGDFFPYKKDSEWHRFSPQDAKLLMFNSKGEYLRTILKAYPSTNGLMFHGFETYFAVSSNKREICVYCRNGSFIRRYDYNGKAITDTKALRKKYSGLSLIGDTLALFDLDSQVIMSNGELKDDGAVLEFYNINKDEIIASGGLDFAQPYDNNKSLADEQITKTCSGIYITTPRTDTIYHINHNLEITPRFLSFNKSEKADNHVYPLAETEEYILFCNGRDALSDKNKKYKSANYIYLKADKQIYRLTCSNPFSENNIEMIWKDELFLNYTYVTQTPNTLAIVLPISFLMENYGYLPAELKHFTDISDKDDNPVLMLIRFGKRIK